MNCWIGYFGWSNRGKFMNVRQGIMTININFVITILHSCSEKAVCKGILLYQILLPVPNKVHEIHLSKSTKLLRLLVCWTWPMGWKLLYLGFICNTMAMWGVEIRKVFDALKHIMKYDVPFSISVETKSIYFDCSHFSLKKNIT